MLAELSRKPLESHQRLGRFWAKRGDQIVERGLAPPDIPPLAPVARSPGRPERGRNAQGTVFPTCEKDSA
jgi:hypothetical protein